VLFLGLNIVLALLYTATFCCIADVATLISKTLGVDSQVLTGVAFTQFGMVIAWRMQGNLANQLSYTVRRSVP